MRKTQKGAVQWMDEKMRRHVIENLIRRGVEFICTDGVVISEEAELEAGVVVYPGTIIEGRTIVEAGAVLGPNTMIVDCQIGTDVRVNSSQCYQSIIESGAKIGPFSHIRPHCHIMQGVKVGAYVEVKNTNIGEHTSLAHLCYVGDADVGRNVNFGCGTITVNYDGVKKYRTTVEDEAFIGCNSNLVAPVRVGKGAYIAAGSTITEEVPGDALAIGRCRQTNKENWAANWKRKRSGV